MKLNKKTERLIKRKAAELKKLYETPNPEVDKIISELRAEATKRPQNMSKEEEIAYILKKADENCDHIEIRKILNESNTSFERSANASDEWYTPREIIEALGEFDLDPCAPMHPLWPTAKIMYNKQDNGLIQNWGGRIWLNPPYSRPLIEQFVKRLAEHGNGIALLFNRCDSKMFQDVIFKKATAMKFLRNRIRFFRPDGTRGDSPGCGSVLIAFGRENAEILRNCSLQGKYVELNNDK